MFAIVVATGGLLGLLFDFFRVFRGAINPRVFVTSLLDLLYWLIATVIVFGAMLLGNWGELRMYIFIGLLVGAALYFRWFSLCTMRVSMSILHFLVRGLRWVKVVVLFGLFIPVGYCIKILARPFVFIKRQIRANMKRAAHWCTAKGPRPPGAGPPE